MVIFMGESGARWEYEPTDELGRGTFGAVFRGAAADGSPVAVKRVGLPLDTEGHRRRREREVEISDKLAAQPTRHVLQPLDIAREGDDLLIVMPLASRSLYEALTTGALDGDQALAAFREVALGLQELAAASIVHRDLKPANVLEVEGRWQLSDFGIARDLLEPTGTYTMTGWGTWPYMAPELWTAQPASVKSDLYALGVVGWECLVGRQPFLGPGERDFRRQHATEAPPDPGPLAVRVRRLLGRLLAKNSAERPQDARAVVEDLQQVAAQHATLAALMTTSAALEQTRRQREAETATQAAADSAWRILVEQAHSDLRQLLDEATEMASDVDPAIVLQTAQTEGAVSRYVLHWPPHLHLTVRFWPGIPGPDAGAEKHPRCIVAGEVRADVVHHPWPLANIMSREVAGRLEWKLWRFHSSGSVGNNYNVGPVGRRHGFDQHAFLSEYPFMAVSAGHIWTLDERPLTATALIGLLDEAAHL